MGLNRKLNLEKRSLFGSDSSQEGRRPLMKNMEEVCPLVWDEAELCVQAQQGTGARIQGEMPSGRFGCVSPLPASARGQEAVDMDGPNEKD